MKTWFPFVLPMVIVFLLTVVGCGGGNDEFSQPTKQVGNSADSGKPKDDTTASPSATPTPPRPATPAPGATANTTVEAQSPPPASGSEGGGIGLFGAAEPAPAAPIELGSDPAASTASEDDGLAADLSADGRLLVAERGDGRFGVYEVARRISLMSLSAAENNIRKLSFDSNKGLITAILPSGKLQVWKYQSTLGLDKFAKESIAADSFLRGFEGHQGGTLDLAISPTRDEMATVGADGQLRFWRVNNGASTRTFERSGTELQNLTASSGGGFAAAMTSRGVATIWETATGKARTLPVGDRSVTCAAIDSRGGLLAVGDSSGTVVLLDVTSGRTNELSFGRKSVADVRFEEESQRLFAIASDGETRAWNLPLSSSTTIDGISSAGGLMAVSPDMKRIAVPNEQGGLRSVAISGDKAIHELTTGLERISAMEYADGDAVFVGGENGQIEIQEDTGLKKLIATNGSGISQLKWSGGGSLATLDRQGNAGIWSVGRSRIIARFADETVVTSANDPASAALAIVFRSGKYVVVDLSTGETIATRQSADENVTNLALDSQRGLVALGHSSGKVSLWQYREKSELIPLGQHSAAVTQIRIAESGEFVYTGAADGTICNWPTQIKDAAPVLEKLPGEIQLADFASQKAIGVVSTETAVYAMDLRTGSSRHLAGLPLPVRLRISPDGSQFAMITPEGIANLYDTASGVLLRQHLATEQIVDVAFQDVEKTCLTLDKVGAVRRLTQPRSGLPSIKESLIGAQGIWLNPAGSILAVAAESRLIRFLSVADNYKLLSTVNVENGVDLLAWTGDQSCAVTSPGAKSVSLVELQGSRVQKTIVDLPGPATQFCRRADNSDLLAICGTRLLKVRPASGDIRVNDISFKASDRDQIVNCGKTTMLLSGGRIFRIGRDDKVVIDERVANIKSLAGSVSEQSALLVTESGNMLVFSDNKYTDAGVNPVPEGTVTISDDGRYLWIQPQSGEGMIWSVREQKILQKVSFAGTPAFRSWLPNQSALVQIDAAGSVELLESLVTLEWTTGVANAQSLSVSPAGNLALVKGIDARAAVVNLVTGEARVIETSGTVFAEISDDVGTVVTVGGTGKVDRITPSGVETKQIESPVLSVSMDRTNRTILILVGADKSVLLNADKLSEVQMLPAVQDYKRTFSTAMGFMLSDGAGQLKFAERGVQASGTPRPGHKGGCTGIVLLPNQVITSGRDGVIRTWSPDLANERDLLNRGRAIVSLAVAPGSLQISACDELGEALILNQEGTVVSNTNKIGLGPGSRTFGDDGDGNLLVAGVRQVVRFRTDGTPRDGLQFKEDCVEIGRVGNTGTWFAVEKNGNLYGFDFVKQRCSIQRSSKVSGLHWTTSSQIAVASGKQIEIITSEGAAVANAATDTEVVASGVSPNGQHLAVLSVSGDLGLYETKSLNKTNSFKPGVAANRIAVGLTGESVLLFGIDSAEEWTNSGTRLRRLPTTGVNSASYVEGTPFLITAHKNGEVRQWPRQQMFSSQPASTVKDARLLPNGAGTIFVDDKGLISGESADKKVYWKSKEPILDIRSLSSSLDGTRVAILTGTNGARHAAVFDQKTGLIKEFDIPAVCSSVQLSPDGESLLMNLEESVEIRNISSGLVTQSLNIEAKKCLFLTTSSVLMVDGDGVLRAASTGELGTMQISSGQATAVAFDEAGDLIATGTTEGIITIWDRASSELRKLHEFTTESPVRQIILRGSMLIARTDLAAVSIWSINLNDPAASGNFSFAHRGIPLLLKLDRRQELLATVSSENEVAVWDLSTKGGAARQVLSLTGHDQRVSALAFSEASDSLVSLDASGTVSISPLPDISVLRQRAVAEVMSRESSGLLEELPISLPGAGRSGNDALSQRLRQEDSVRRDLQALRNESQDNSVPRLGNRRTVEEVVQSIGYARSTQMRGLYQDRIAKSGGQDITPPSGKEPPWTPAPGIVEDYRSVRSLPAAIAAAGTGAAKSTGSGSSPQEIDTAEGLVRELVSSQRAFVRQLSGSVLKGFADSASGLSIDQKALDAFRQQLEQMSDSRAIQTIPTDYRFPREGADAVSIPLQISSDGSTVAASFPPLPEEEASKGYLDIWDTLSAIPLKRFELNEGVQELLLSALEDQLLTMPAVSAYRMFDNGPPRYLTHGSTMAWNRSAEIPVVAITRQVGRDTQDQLLALYDARSMDSLPISMPEGFDTRAKAVAFGHVDDKLAVAISERGKDHKLFVCRTSDLARFEVLKPVDSVDGSSFSKSDGGVGFPALAFSQDDQTLVAVAHGSDGTAGFSVRLYGLKSEKWGITVSMPLPEEGFVSVDDRIAVNFVAQLARVSIRTSAGIFVGDLNASKKRRSDAVWGIPLSPETTRTVNLSDDGRWLAIGKSNGTIAIHDLSSSDPTLSVPLPAEGDTAHDGPVIGLSFSRPMQGTRTPTYLASFGRENRLKVWALIDLEEQFVRAGKAR